MEPNRFGRKLGIGMRIASKMVKERAAHASASATSTTRPRAATPQSATPPSATRPPAAARPAAPPRPPRNYAEPARRVGVGTRNFGSAFFGPFARMSVTLWLEITGLFFALFALFFAQNAWKTRADFRAGPEHAHFLLYCLCVLVFVYFCCTSFLKAARRTSKARR